MSESEAFWSLGNAAHFRWHAPGCQKRKLLSTRNSLGISLCQKSSDLSETIGFWSHGNPQISYFWSCSKTLFLTQKNATAFWVLKINRFWHNKNLWFLSDQKRSFWHLARRFLTVELKPLFSDLFLAKTGCFHLKWRCFQLLFDAATWLSEPKREKVVKLSNSFG